MAAIKVRDSGWRLDEAIAEFDGAVLQAGIFDDEEYASLALLHEDGSDDGRVKRRRSMRPAFDAGEDAAVAEIDSAFRLSLAQGVDAGPYERQRKIAANMAERHRQVILRGKAEGPALSKEYAAWKGFAIKLLGKPKQGRVHMVDKIEGRVLRIGEVPTDG
jgi:hypothetical protein